MEDPLVKISEAARHLGVSLKTLRRWEQSGKLSAQRTIGNQRRYSLSHLEAFKSKAIKPKTNQVIEIDSIPEITESTNSHIKRHALKMPFGHKTILAIFTIGVIVAGLGMYSKIAVNTYNATVKSNGTPVDDIVKAISAAVLADSTKANDFLLKINVPSTFSEDATFSARLFARGLANLSGGVDTSNADLNAGTGILTASNVIYSITAGTGLSSTGGQNPTLTNTGVTSFQGSAGSLVLVAGSGISISGLNISNSDPGSAQKIFKTMSVNGTDITAGSNTDTLTFAQGSGITLSGDSSSKTITISASSSAGTTDLYWNQTNGALYPNNSSVDLLVGGQSSASAKFGFINVSSATPAIQINGTTVLNPTTLGSGVVNSSLTSVGTLTSGTWNATAIGSQYGGTGQNSTGWTGVPYVTGGTWASTSGLGTSSQCLLGGATPAFGSCATGASDSFWNQQNGALFANNSTVDLLIGGQSTSSAKFKVLNIASGTPVASISANSGNNAVFLTGAGNLATTNGQALTLGGSTTGDINLNPLNSDGTVFVNDHLDVNGHAAFGAGANVDTSLEVINIVETLNPSANTKRGILNTVTSDTAFATGALYGMVNRAIGSHASGTSTWIAGLQTHGLLTGAGTVTDLIGNYAVAEVSNATTGTVTEGVALRGAVVATDGTISTGYGLRVDSATDNAGTGVITNNYGIQVQTQTVGASDYGIRVDAADTQTLWISGNANNTTAAAGIAFGSSRDTNLYRSAPDTLRTDDAFNVNGNINLSSAGIISGATGLTSSGTITFSNFTNNGGVLYANGSGVLAQTAAGTSNQCLLGGTNPSFGSCATGTADAYWFQSNGALYPNNSSVDLLVGGQSTSSAKFRFINVASGTPIASISANSGNIATYLTGDGTLGVTNRADLTIGNSSAYNTTGNILLNPNAIGNVGIGITTPSYKLDIAGTSTATTGSDILQNLSLTVNPLINSAASITGLYNGINTQGSSNLNVVFGGQFVIQNLGSGNVNSLNALNAVVAVEGPATTAVGVRSSISGDSGLTNDAFGFYTSMAQGISNNAYGLYIGALGGNTSSYGVYQSETSANNYFGGKVGVGAISPLATLDVRANEVSGGTIAVASVSGQTSFAALVADQSGAGDIFTASASGLPLFTISKAGNVIPGTNAGQDLGSLTRAWRNVYGTTYYSGASVGITSSLGCVSSTLGIVTGSGVCPSTSSGSPFRELSGAIVPNNSTEDFLIGGQSTTSAKFAILGVNGTRGTQSASVSGNLVLDSSTAAIQTTLNQGLTIGGDTTGNIVLSPRNGAGSVQINTTGATTYALQVAQSGNALAEFLNTGALSTSGGAGMQGHVSAYPTTAGQRIGFLTFGSNVSGTVRNAASIEGFADGTWSSTDTPSYLTFHTTPAGSSTRLERLRIDQSGHLIPGANGTQDLGSASTAWRNVYGTTYYSGASVGVTASLGCVSSTLGIVTGSGACPTSSTDTFWNQSAGALFPNNSTVDLLVGGQSTAAAKFGFINVSSGTPAIQINGTTVLSPTALGAGVVSSSLTSVGTLTVGTWNATAIASQYGGTGQNSTGWTGIPYVTAGTWGSTSGLGTSSQCLLGGVTPAFGSCGTGTSDPFWSQANGALFANNSTVDLLIGGQSTASALFRVTGSSALAGTKSVASISARTSFAALVVDQSGNGDLITASASGLPIFTITKSGNVIPGVNGNQDIGTSLLSWRNVYGTTFYSGVTPGISTTGCVTSTLGIVTAAATCPNSSIDTFWNQTNGALFANNSTVDLLVGGQSTASALFRVTGSSPFAGTTSVASIAARTSFAAMVIDQSGVGDVFSASASGNPLFTIAKSGNVGIGTTIPTEKLQIEGGNILIGQKTNTSAVNDQAWTKASNAAGTIADDGGATTGIASPSAMAVYNGSLYVGTTKTNAAEVYRYDGGSNWTLVSNTTAGTITSGGTANIDSVSAMTVVNGKLYIGTTESNAAQVYRYNNSSSWTLVSGTGSFGSTSGQTNIDGVTAMIALGGRLIIGTKEPEAAEVYGMDGEANEFNEYNTTPGTFLTTTGVDGVSSMVAYGNNFLFGTFDGVARAELYFGAGAGNISKASSGTAGFIGAEGTVDYIKAMAVYGGRLYVGISKGGQANLMIYNNQPPFGGNNMSKLFSADGTPKSGGTANIDGVSALGVYNGHLYMGTEEPNGAEIYRVEGNIGDFTKMSQSAAGVVAAGGTSGIDIIASMAQYNNDIFIGTDKDHNAGEVYKQTTILDQSYALQFEADTGAGGGIQNSFKNIGSISFLASPSGFLNTGNANTGSFLFSHGILTNTGAYDVAEDYPTRDESLEPGDIVSTDLNEESFVQKSNGEYDNRMLGIYSERPGFRLSQLDNTINGGRAVPIALVGRVPVKVSTQSGEIKIGDFLTSSGIPGVAMKATRPGQVIGIALQGFKGEGGEIGRVQVRVSPSWHDPSVYLTSSGVLNVNTNSNTDQVVAFIASKEEKPEKQVLSGATPSAAMTIQPKISNLFSDSSATLSGELNVFGSSILNGAVRALTSIITPNLIVSDFATFFADVVFKGNVRFDSAPTFNNDTAGFAVIEKNGKDVSVTFSQEYNSSPVVTATLSLDNSDNSSDQKAIEDLVLNGNVSYIVTNKSTKGFTIKLNKPAPSDLNFSWVALVVKDPKTQKSNAKIEVQDPVSTQSAAFQSILNQLGNESN